MIKLSSGFFAITCSVLFALGACSCSDNDDKNKDPQTPTSKVTISVTPESLGLTPESGKTTVAVIANADWSITSDASWCTIFPSGGLKDANVNVTVTYNANKDKEPRHATLTITSGTTKKTIAVEQACEAYIEAVSSVNFGAQKGTTIITINSNYDWTATCDASWLKVTPSDGKAGTTNLEMAYEANTGSANRTATVKISNSFTETSIKVTQLSDEIATPEGYTLVWNDEFNTADGTQPDLTKWWYEEWAPGFVNNELQRYVAGSLNGNKTAEIKGGILNITAMKNGKEVISARLNTKELWLYGYFEARLKLPKGKGTWPAFWMMPANGNNWPHCGEIDIMEEVGVNPNYTSSSIHCSAYNHTIGTQKTAERLTPGAEDEFHVYALEWTPEYIRTYVDGKLLLTFNNDGKGDENTWPFNKPFHPILNLAWGGSWGGMSGVDENALPTTYQIDYVRVFQKL